MRYPEDRMKGILKPFASSEACANDRLMDAASRAYPHAQSCCKMHCVFRD